MYISDESLLTSRKMRDYSSPFRVFFLTPPLLIPHFYDVRIFFEELSSSSFIQTFKLKIRWSALSMIPNS